MEQAALKELLLGQKKRFEQRLDLISQDEVWRKENQQEAQRLEIQGLHEETQTLSGVIKDHSRKLLEQTKQTLFRLENGQYGICSKCKSAIELERLKILPTTTFCKGCK